MLARILAKRSSLILGIFAILSGGLPASADVTIRSSDGKSSFSGDLIDTTEDHFILKTVVGVLRMDRHTAVCDGDECPREEMVTILAGAQLGEVVRLQSPDGSLSISGQLTDFRDQVYGLKTEIGLLTFAATDVICDGAACPVETLVARSSLPVSLVDALAVIPIEIVPVTPTSLVPETDESAAVVQEAAPTSSAPVQPTEVVTMPDDPYSAPTIEPSGGFGDSPAAPAMQELSVAALPRAPHFSPALSQPAVTDSPQDFIIPQINFSHAEPVGPSDGPSGFGQSVAIAPPAELPETWTAAIAAPQERPATEVEPAASLRITAPAWMNAATLPVLLQEFASASQGTLSLDGLTGVLDAGSVADSAKVELSNSDMKHGDLTPITLNIGDNASTEQASQLLGHSARVAIVSPANALTAISVDQLQDVMSGKITNWGALGRKPAAINVYSLGTTGTQTTTFKTAAELEDAVASDPDALALVPFSVPKTAKVLPLIESCGIEHVADAMAVNSGSYPMTQPVFIGINRDQVSVVEDTFYTEVVNGMSDETLINAGLFPATLVRGDLSARAASYRRSMSAVRGETERLQMAALIDLMANSDAISSVFRFRGSSLRLDPQSTANIKRLISHFAEGPAPAELYLVGFSDNVGGFAGNQVQSLRRANAVEDLLRQFDKNGVLAATKIEALGMSELAPIACNQQSYGRALNRRVEVWTTKK